MWQDEDIAQITNCKSKPSFANSGIDKYKKHDDGILELPEDPNFKGMIKFLENTSTQNLNYISGLNTTGECTSKFLTGKLSNIPTGQFELDDGPIIPRVVEETNRMVFVNPKKLEKLKTNSKYNRR